MFLGATADIARKISPNFDIGELLSKISLPGYRVEAVEGSRGGIAGLKVDVRECGDGRHSREHRHHRNLSDILEILAASDISPEVREMASAAFTLLAGAEAEVHGTTPDKVHFHEVGAVDSIVDITGAMLMMEFLGWPEVLSGPANVGSGTVLCAHGVLPVPGPAAALLLSGLEIFSGGDPVERTTPTGALLLKLLAGPGGFRGLPAGKIECVGVGLGGRDTPDIPNALRAILLDVRADESRFLRDEASLLEANIDDMNPQDYALAAERLFGEGALDVWWENITMKKARPGVKFCCLARPCDAERFAELIMRNTTTIGVRISDFRRMTLERDVESRLTPLGEVRFKSAYIEGALVRSSPEHDDLVKIARDRGLSLDEVREIVRGGMSS
jgi:uncharacterized protein (TIGR00299 family) protein